MAGARPIFQVPSAVSDVQGVRASDRTLQLVRDLVNEHTGMYYDEPRLPFLRDRLAPLVIDRGFDSLLDYYYLLKYDPSADKEWARAVDALAVQETYFWREADQLTALAHGIMPRLVERGRRAVRIWSVPCASGEEPLSIAMALDDAGWFDRLPIEIHASDASEAALRRAATGQYGERSFRQIPPALRQKYFEPAVNGQTAVKASLRARVTSWSRVNVVRRDEVTPHAVADVIFCRNLFIYFVESTVRQVVDQFAERMPSPAFLCVGAAESLLRVTSRFELQEIKGAHVYVKP
jgi:chemotaxis protein methyltransferase CheR